ncbi:MAG: trans-aconitate 2-methyltransferase [Phycisphaerales bacterium]
MHAEPTGSDPAYLAPYQEAVRRHGAGFAATLWGSRATQILRFDVMDELLPLEGRRILDLGCGQGDLAARLMERGVVFDAFLGIDAVPEMVERASGRDLPRCTFQVADLLNDPAALTAWPADVVCISGTLNTMDVDVARDLVSRCFAHAAHGIVFNFLSDRPHERWEARELAPARRFPTIDWLDWALARTSRVRFDQLYLDGHDATIAMLHDGDDRADVESAAGS